jgi:hypothetical protein
VKKTYLAALIGSVFPAIAGGAISVPDNGAMPDQAGLIAALQGINPFPAMAFNAVATNTPATLTSAQMAGGQDSYVNMTATLAGAGTLNVPTAANFIAALPPTAQVVGVSGVLRIINSSSGAFAWTVTTATGWTLNGTMSIAQNTWRDFVWQVTGVGASAAVTLQQVGTGTTS